MAIGCVQVAGRPVTRLSKSERQLSWLPELAQQDATLSRIVRRGVADSTLERYAAACRSWLRWCHDHGEPPQDASTACLIRWLSCRMAATGGVLSPTNLGVSLAAARLVQRAYTTDAEEPQPYLRSSRPRLDDWCASIVKEARPVKRTAPLLARDLVALCDHIANTVRSRQGVDWRHAVELAVRDRALILLGWWGCLRADELARLTWGQVAWVTEGVELHLTHSKTGPAIIAVARTGGLYCPVAALWEWSGGERVGDTRVIGAKPIEQSVFGLGRPGLAQVIRRRALAAGLRGCTGHSLRVGFATEASRQEVPDRLVQRHARWTSSQQHGVYVRAGNLWRETPTLRVRLPQAPDGGPGEPPGASALLVPEA